MPLYHFTDSRNLPSILGLGLRSWYDLERRGVKHIPGSSPLSRQLDARKNLQDYVRLSLRPSHPMATVAINEGRIARLVWLTVDDAVLRWRSTLFSDCNAAANAAIINSDPETALNSTDIQAEILVKGSVAVRWITFPEEVNLPPALRFRRFIPF